MPLSAALSLVGRAAGLRSGPRPLVELVKELPRHGSGFRVARAKWVLGDTPSHIDITRVAYLKVQDARQIGVEADQAVMAVIPVLPFLTSSICCGTDPLSSTRRQSTRAR